ncbi:MAG: hypothetical protein ACXW2P_03265, partial [Thermoanaerobaculia bacterium]
MSVPHLAATTRSWTGASSALWSDGANWNPAGVPTAGDTLVFPDFAANLINVNDLPVSTLLTSIIISGRDYTISGNAIQLSGGMTVGHGVNAFNIPIQLTASQTFTAGGESSTRFTLGGAIDLQAHTLTLGGQCTVGGAISGTGGVTIANTGGFFAYVVLSGANSYSGATTNERFLVINGTQSTSAVSNGGFLGGTGTIGSVTGGQIGPGPVYGSFNGAGILQTGNLGGTGGSAEFELNDATPGTGHDQIAVTGTVNVNGITLNAYNGGWLVPSVGQVFTLIANDGADAVIGTFTGRPQH